MTLAEHAAAFEEHGPVRDIYVLDTTIDDWQRLLDHLRTSHHRLDFRVGGDPAPLPPQPAEVFAHNATPDVATADLHVDLGGYQIATFFWEAGNIQFTVFPELIDTEQRYQALMGLPRGVGHGDWQAGHLDHGDHPAARASPLVCRQPGRSPAHVQPVMAAIVLRWIQGGTIVGWTYGELDVAISSQEPPLSVRHGTRPPFVIEGVRDVLKGICGATGRGRASTSVGR